MTEDEKYVTLKWPTVKEVIEELKEWPQDIPVSVQLASVYDKHNPKTHTRLYFLTLYNDDKKNILLSSHECWNKDGTVYWPEDDNEQ